MFHRVVEIQEENRYVSLERGFLKISQGNTKIGQVPVDDVAVLLVSAQSVSFSKHILNELAGRGGISVLCGKNYVPQSMVMPVAGHYMQAGVIKTQIEASLPFKKNIWKQIVENKLRNQAKTLAACGNGEMAARLNIIAGTVKSGDTGNREAVGAKLYWKALFGDTFKRDKDGDGINALLNYGYAVVRASFCRAICAAGLLPSFGVFHENALNPFCLADDFIEPFRPIVDSVVRQLTRETVQELTPEIKRRLVDILLAELETSEGRSPLCQAAHYLCSSYVGALKTKKPEIAIPVWEGAFAVSGSESL